MATTCTHVHAFGVACSDSASLPESEVASLLRLLAPRPGATETEETMRSNLIMRRAVRGPALEFEADGMDGEAADRLRALQILQSVLGGGSSVEQSAEDAAPVPPRCGAEVPVPAAAAAGAAAVPAEWAPVPDVEPAMPDHAVEAGPAISMHELEVRFDNLPKTVRLLEATDSEEATRAYSSAGEADPFGAKAWPAAYLAAQRLLTEGVQGRSVLELGCGTGLVSIAALLGGAKAVLATDRAWPNVERALASARINGQQLHGAVFDVTLAEPLPTCQSGVGGSLHAPSRTDALPEHFDYVIFSDVLYWPREAAAFGRRAAEAFAAGSTVIVADPGRRRDDFLAALRGELVQLGVDPLPAMEPTATQYPHHVYEWVSAEVRTASSLFCHEPFELVLRQRPTPSGSLAMAAPASYERVD
mmetsp:Transcript_108119/g.316109  ORF Transcript_108119/g.316109 Transcript_108119/m.316109 type:complete len:417 (+) Transcript_108119:78-1328(+)